MPNPLARAAGLMMPACGHDGAAGLDVPVVMDMDQLRRPATPNTALAAPANFLPRSDIATRRYAVMPAALYGLIRDVALAQTRTVLHAAFDERMQAHFVARSALLNFPDLITAQILPDGGLVLWSRSVYGQSDLGVNRKRLVAWLAALDRAVEP